MVALGTPAHLLFLSYGFFFFQISLLYKKKKRKKEEYLTSAQL